MKDLEDFDLNDEADGDPLEREPGLDLEDAAEHESEPDPRDDSDDAAEPEGPSQLEASGELPEFPPDVTPERPLVPPLAWLLLLLIALPALLYLGLRPSGTQTLAEPDPGSTPLGVAPLPAPEPEAAPAADAPLELPPLDQSDAAVRALLAALGSHPELTRWLGQKQLVRTFVVVVENVADGERPAPHLRFLAPEGAFRVRDTQAGPVLDPAGYQRYDVFAAALGSADAAGAARRYRDLGPLVDAAYRELGHGPGAFDATLLRAIDKLLATPIAEGEPPLRRHSVSYAWADARLESLEPAQKHLLRTGPRNQRAIQTWLRALRSALRGSPTGGATGGAAGTAPTPARDAGAPSQAQPSARSTSSSSSRP